MEYQSNLRNLGFGKRVIAIITAGVFGVVAGSQVNNVLKQCHAETYRRGIAYTTAPMPEAILPDSEILKMANKKEEEKMSNGRKRGH